VQRVNVSSTGTQANIGLIVAPAISSDGMQIAFFTLATNLVPIDTNGDYDVFVTDFNYVNHAPLAMNDEMTVNEDSSISGSLTATDADGDALTFSIVTNGTRGTAVVTNPATGAFTYTPQPNVNGADTFTFKASDGFSDSNEATIAVTITPVNDAPLAYNDGLTTLEDTPADGTLPASDVDGDPLTYRVVTNGLLGTLAITDPATGAFTYTPNANAVGLDVITWVVNDGTVDSISAQFIVTITAVNDAPIAEDGAIATHPETSRNGTLQAHDPDNDVILTFTVVTPPAHGTVNMGVYGAFVYTPKAGFTGEDAFTFVANDGFLDSNIATETIQVSAVNLPPDAVDDTAVTAINEMAVIDVLANDTDPEGDALWVTGVTQPAHGLAQVVIKYVDKVEPKGKDGKNFTYKPFVTYQPASGFQGTDAFTYTISDTYGGTDTATVTIAFGLNHRPTAVDTIVSGGAGTPVSGTLVATDADGDALTFSITNSPAHGSVVLDNPATGAFTYTPAAGYVGPDIFYFKVNDGQVDSNVAECRISDTESPLPLPLAVDDEAMTNDELPVVIDVLMNDYNPDGVPLAITAITQGSNGTVAINPDNTLTYTPTVIWGGNDVFTYTLNSVSTATVNVTINHINHPPAAQPDTATTEQDTPVTIEVLANDDEGGDPGAPTDRDGDYLVVSAVTAPAHGMAEIVTIGIAPKGKPALTGARYTPAAGYLGTDAFDYTVSDGMGGSAVAHVTITVTEPNHAPTATDGYHDMLEDIAVDGTLQATDPDGDPLTFRIVDDPAHGAVVIHNTQSGAFTYTPGANYHGPDQFTFAANDGTVDSNIATIYLDVSDVNDAPVAHNGTLTVEEDSIDNPGTLSATDVDGDPLTYSIATPAAHGTAAITDTATGAYAYTPNADYSGSDAFTFTASDGVGLTSDPATISITVTALPQYTITPGAGTYGSIAPNTPQSVKQGHDIGFTATPNTGYQVGVWKLDGATAQTGGTGYMLANVTSAHAVNVTFKLQTFTITASASTGGTISPSGAQTVNYGGYLFFQAKPNTGYGVATWKVDNVDVQTGGLSYELNSVTQNHTVAVTYYVDYPAPTVTGITPNTHENTGKLSVTELAGTDFRADITVQLRKTGQPSITATNIQVVSATKITCDFNFFGNAIGAWDVVATNDDGKSDTLAGAVTLTLAPPVIVAITPNAGVKPGTVAITNLAGSGFVNPAVELRMTGELPIPMTGVILYGPTMISGTFDLTGAVAGAWDVVVTNGDSQSATLVNGFTIAAEPAPAPTGVSPASVQKPGTKTLTVNGVNFAGDATVTLTKSGETDHLLAITSRTATKLVGTLDISAMAVGQWNVMVTNHPGTGAAQSAILPNALAVTEAALSGVTLTTDKAWPQPTGATITLTAHKVGVAPSVEYQFWARVFNQTTSRSEYSLLRDYQTDDNYAWKPTSNNSYWLYVYAREEGSAVAYQVVSPEVYFKVEVPTLTGVTLAVAPPPVRPVGTPITLTATKSGTAEDVEYSFIYKWYNPDMKRWDDGYLRGYEANNNTYIWTPTIAGQYRLFVLARIVGSAAVFDRISPFKTCTIQ